MKLHDALRKIIREHGTAVLGEKRLVFLLMDFRAFDDCPAMRRVMLAAAQNGWIDENDDIFDKLRIWSKDPDGSDRLTTLKESDVGAIYLDSRRTEFAVKDLSNKDRAQVRRTGIFLRESTGRAGTVQQFDMVKQAYA